MARRTRVYFDHNVVDHPVKRHNITDEQVHQPRSMGKGRTFDVTLSITNLDEIIAGLRSPRPEQAIEQLRLTRDVIGFAYLLKPPDQLLTHAFVDFAFDLPPREAVTVMHPVMREHLERFPSRPPAEVACFPQAPAKARY